nr:hypothetical protein CFP56_02030 [Quercus suber]
MYKRLNWNLDLPNMILASRLHITETAEPGISSDEPQLSHLILHVRFKLQVCKSKPKILWVSTRHLNSNFLHNSTASKTYSTATVIAHQSI